MPYDECPGVVLSQRLHECMQGGPLCRGARVGIMAVDIEAALVADTDGVSVVVLAVCAHLLLGSSPVNLAIPCDIVVIADILEVPVTDVVVAAVLERVAMILTGGGTVNDNQGDRAHGDLSYDYMQLWMPRVVAMALSTLIMIWISVLMKDFVIFIKLRF